MNKAGRLEVRGVGSGDHTKTTEDPALMQTRVTGNFSAGNHGLSGERLATERAAAGKRFGFLPLRLRRKARTRIDERDPRRRRRSDCENHLSTSGHTACTVSCVRDWT